ncbi:hypothetical protein DUE52_31690 [Larkinella punicea]|uniref:Uncharacterized protein n=1 Tax=Larkinella punicea TaxID=2315727 RepID=A0A368JCV4_9BACT|nr:hypothetical protein DUE52_31690 [Larkinella punicea]
MIDKGLGVKKEKAAKNYFFFFILIFQNLLLPLQSQIGERVEKNSLPIETLVFGFSVTVFQTWKICSLT